jgi:hypothetical protein
MPLLDCGNTNKFKPDFLVWADKASVTINTKGDQLIANSMFGNSFK